MLSFKYALTKEDYVNYYTYVMWDAPERKKKNITYYLRQLLINGFLIAVLIYSDVFSTSRSFLYIYIGALLVITLVQFFSARSGIKKQAERVAENKGNSSIFFDTELQVSETGIVEKDHTKESRFTWSAFTKKQENDQYYFLFTSAIQALIIPKRVIKSAEDKALFEKLLSQHLSFDAEIGHLVKN